MACITFSMSFNSEHRKPGWLIGSMWLACRLLMIVEMKLSPSELKSTEYRIRAKKLYSVVTTSQPNKSRIRHGRRENTQFLKIIYWFKSDSHFIRHLPGIGEAGNTGEWLAKQRQKMLRMHMDFNQLITLLCLVRAGTGESSCFLWRPRCLTEKAFQHSWELLTYIPSSLSSLWHLQLLHSYQLNSI